MGIRCDGTLTQTPDGYPVCDGSWVEEPDVLAQLYELLDAVFSTPDGSDIAVAFMAAFTVPMIAYLSAWGYSKVIHFAEKDESDLT